MTKKEIIEIDRSDEIKQILQNTVDVYLNEELRLDKLMKQVREKRDWANMRLKTYIETGKLLPVEEPD